MNKDRSLYHSQRMDKAYFLKEKILKEIEIREKEHKNYIKNPLFHKISSNIDKQNLIIESEILFKMKEYLKRDDAFLDCYQDTPNDISYLIDDGYIDKWLQDDFHFIDTFLEDLINKEKNKIFFILDDDYFYQQYSHLSCIEKEIINIDLE